MKKYIMLLVLVLCAFLVVGCAKDEKDDKKKDDSKSAEKLTIEETVLVDEDVKIVANSIDYNKKSGMKLKLSITNGTDEDVTYMLRYLKANGILIDAAMYVEVSAGKTANDYIYLSNEDMELAGIEKIKDLEFVVYGNNDDYEDVFESEILTLSTNVEDYEQKINKDGDEVVDQNGITIVAMGSDEDAYGPYVKLYLENNNSESVYISFDDVSVNDVMINPYFSIELPANTKAYAKLSFDEDELDENSIKSIDNVVFDIDAYTNDFEDVLSLKDLVIELK